jgi:hypothetical protein
MSDGETIGAGDDLTAGQRYELTFTSAPGAWDLRVVPAALRDEPRWCRVTGRLTRRRRMRNWVQVGATGDFGDEDGQ